jgi:hypothetical protein
MKKVFVLLTIIGFLGSCSSDDDGIRTKEININVILSNSRTYEYYFGSFGENEGVEIEIQATHFELSELQEFSNNTQVVYKYKATPGYLGNDYVELIAERGSDGVSPSTNIVNLKITFDIIE